MSNAYLQIFPAPLRGSERGRIVSPPCHLSLCLTPSLVGVHHTVGCLPMCCPLIHCMAAFIAKMSYAWRASQRDLRDPGRGDPGFRRCWVGHLRKILLFDLVFYVCFCARSRNSEASSATPLELSGQGSLFWFRCLVGLFAFGFLLLWFFLVLPVVWAWLDLGPRNGPHSTFDSPKRDIAIASTKFVHQHDNVRRPGESHRGAGRKKKMCLRPQHLLVCGTWPQKSCKASQGCPDKGKATFHKMAGKNSFETTSAWEKWWSLKEREKLPFPAISITRSSSKNCN